MKTKILRNENRAADPARHHAGVPAGQGKALARSLTLAVNRLIALPHRGGFISGLGPA
jgi:hypothetical protein